MNITSNQNELLISIQSDNELPLTDKEMRELIRLARNGGFEIIPENNCIKMTASFTKTMTRRVYAVNILDGKRIMLGKLVEIFCHGELVNVDPKPMPPIPEPLKKKPAKKKNTK